MLLYVRVRIVLLLLPMIALTESARILGVFPFFARSHHRVIQPVMKTLALAGHEVVVYSPFPLDTPTPNYTDVYLENITTEGDKITKIFSEATDLPAWKCFDIWFETGVQLLLEEFCLNKKVQRLLDSKEKFDVVFTEPFTTGQEFTLVLSHVFKAPIIGIQTFATHEVLNSNAGNTLSLSYISNHCVNYPNRMTFLQRLFNTFCGLRTLYIYYNYHMPELEDKVRKIFPNIPPLTKLMKNISLSFVNDHVTTDHIRPRTPNIIPVAGIHIESTKPLPQNIKSFMDDATDGVILFSLGTYVADELQPRQYFDMYVNVFRRLQQRVLWKTRKGHVEGLPENVMTASWLPQQDILAHPRCVLFITHGGLLSQHEAVHFAVPVVAVPQFGDQHRNVRMYQEKEVGVVVDNKDLSEATMLKAIRTVLHGTRYRDHMRRLSRIFRDQPRSPAETVLYWTEYVIRHGGAEHLRPASADLHWYQITLLDVMVALLALHLGAAAVFYFIIKNISLRWSKTKKEQ